MERLKRSWKLFRISFTVLCENKKLFLFPLIALLGCIGIGLFFFLGTAEIYIGHYERSIDWRHSDDKAVLVPLYLILMFLVTFINVAFCSEIIHALNGNGVSIKRGLGLAWSKVLQILVWSLFAGLVGYIIKSLEDNFGIIGRIVMRLIGMAWSIASVFAIPVIIREDRDVNPLKHLKTSVSVLKKTWGESIAGYIGFAGIGIAFILFSLMIFGLILCLVVLCVTHGFHIVPLTLILLGTVPWIIVAITFSIVCSMAEKVYLCSLYIYATEGVIPEHFSREDMDTAWKISKKNGLVKG